jgi:hypothetical protein
MSGQSRHELRVGAFKKKKHRTSEASFETTFSAALLLVGRKSWHMLCDDPGWPDRYLGGGTWAELKSLHRLSADNQLEPEQIAKMTELVRHGDTCYYVAKFEASVIIERWPPVTLAPMHMTRYPYRTTADLAAILEKVL